MELTEKVGAFYLGRKFNPETPDAISDELTLYDAKDLTTHAVCVGMTGSGKTGLGIVLLEEAAIDGIPIIAIDPKGDMGNLLLTFPQLAPADFEPWISPGDASRKGRTLPEHAAATAETWKAGLADWHQTPERIALFAAAVERTLYTPGSTAGTPVSVLKSFDAPGPALLNDVDALRERIVATVSGLLTLVGIEPDPIRSREHILISTILDRAWRESRSLSTAQLIREIQTPPFKQIGVFDLDTFFPPKDRLSLAMSLNNLIASPGFSAWMEGAPMSIPDFLFTKEGKPKLSVFSIAHLSDPERMFFVTLLLNEVLAWVRSQPGTPSLRAILYMDEVFGYFPPTANPPSKTPMLTLLKQARAYGLGVILATQNPVDLDYKGLSNTGTWFLGRLQTERDKLRVLEGLEGASLSAGSSFDRASLDKILSGLGNRVFLMNNVHDDGPVLFQTRWALSYLAGPLSREQIRRLAGPPMAPEPTPKPTPEVQQAPTPTPAPTARPAGAPSDKPRPLVPPDVPERFVPATVSTVGTYRPWFLARASLHYIQAKSGVDIWKEIWTATPMSGESGPDWERLSEIDLFTADLVSEPEAGWHFGVLLPEGCKARSYVSWAKQLKDSLYRDRPLKLRSCPSLDLVARPDEKDSEFASRVHDAAREKSDLEISKVRKAFETRFASLEGRIRTAQRKVETEAEQYSAQRTQTVISIGSTLLGALFGRKLGSLGNVGRASTAARGMTRAARERGDISRAQADLVRSQQELADLDAEFQSRLAEVQRANDPAAIVVDTILIAPRKSDLGVEPPMLLWIPYNADGGGRETPAIPERLRG